MRPIQGLLGHFKIERERGGRSLGMGDEEFVSITSDYRIEEGYFERFGQGHLDKSWRVFRMNM